MKLSNEIYRAQVKAVKKFNHIAGIKPAFNYDDLQSPFKNNNYTDPILIQFMQNLEELTFNFDVAEDWFQIKHIWMNDFNYYIIIDNRDDDLINCPFVIVNYKQRGNIEAFYDLDEQQPIELDQFKALNDYVEKLMKHHK